MSPQVLTLLVDATSETLLMVGVSELLATLLGLPLGVGLAITGRGDLLPCLPFNRVGGLLINATRSTPFSCWSCPTRAVAASCWMRSRILASTASSTSDKFSSPMSAL